MKESNWKYLNIYEIFNEALGPFKKGETTLMTKIKFLASGEYIEVDERGDPCGKVIHLAAASASKPC